MSDLVEKYLEVINQTDLCPLLAARQEEPLYHVLANSIVVNDPNRAQHFFNDIVAFQVIPEIIAVHVAKGYYAEVLVFIDRMMKSPHLSDFWEAIPVNARLDYYEQAVFVALQREIDPKAKDFVMQVIETHDLLGKGLAKCIRLNSLA
ncbi:hypothetical protein H4R34_005877, partial [Dimargaris verticillata]